MLRLSEEWRYEFALEHLDRALVTNALNFKARNLKSAALRRLGREAEAETFTRETITLDPLDFWARNELVLLDRSSPEELADLMRGDGSAVEAHHFPDDLPMR